MKDEMVSRVEKQLREMALNCPPDVNLYEALARIAILTMRNPTTAMAHSGGAEIAKCGDNYPSAEQAACEVYVAMIDEALR